MCPQVRSTFVIVQASDEDVAQLRTECTLQNLHRSPMAKLNLFIAAEHNRAQHSYCNVLVRYESTLIIAHYLHHLQRYSTAMTYLSEAFAPIHCYECALGAHARRDVIIPIER